MLNESTNRFLTFVEDPEYKFGIMSVYINDSDKTENDGDRDEIEQNNKDRHAKFVRSELYSKDISNYGFFQLRGLFKEIRNNDEKSTSNRREVIEQSVMIHEMERENLIDLGRKYNQESVIWHGDGKIELIDCKTTNSIKEYSIVSIMGSEPLSDYTLEQLKMATEDIIGTWLKKGKNRYDQIIFEEKMSRCMGRAILVDKYGKDTDKIWKPIFEFVNPAPSEKIEHNEDETFFDTVRSMESRRKNED